MGMKTRLAGISCAFALVASIFLLLWPFYTDGSRPVRKTLPQTNGAWIVIPVMLPVAVAVLPLVFRRQPARVFAAILLSAFTIIAGMSVGLLYAPAALLMILCACVADSARWRDAVP